MPPGSPRRRNRLNAGRLSLKIALAMAPAIAGVLILFGLATAFREGELIEQEMQRDATAVAASLARTLDGRDEADARSQVAELDRQMTWMEIRLAPLADTHLEARIESARAAGGLVVAGAATQLDGEAWSVMVVEPLSERDQFVQRALLVDALSIAVATLVAVAFAVAVGRVVVAGRVDAVIVQLARVGRGDFPDEPLALGRDELGNLGDAVNELVGQLHAAQDEAAREAEARRIAQLQLRRADRLAAVGQTVAVLAHEIGTPLGVIFGRADRLLREGQPEAVQNNARSIKEQAERVAAFVRRLLDYSRHDDSFTLVRLDLRAPVRRAFDLVAERARAADVTLELDLPAEAVVVDGDDRALQQVAANLILNAIDASPRASTIRTRLRLDGEQVRLEVQDQGSGIPEGLQQRIFEPFFTTKPPSEGTGLGLSIVQEIVQDHGGRITIAETSERGSTLCVTMALAGGAA